jgi:hypothetical protein
MKWKTYENAQEQNIVGSFQAQVDQSCGLFTIDIIFIDPEEDLKIKIKICSSSSRGEMDVDEKAETLGSASLMMNCSCRHMARGVVVGNEVVDCQERADIDSRSYTYHVGSQVGGDILESKGPSH